MGRHLYSTFLMCLVALVAVAQPKSFSTLPTVTPTTSTEVATATGGEWKKFTIGALRSILSLGVRVSTISYVPTATGNTTDLNSVVKHSDGRIWVIDWEGDATLVYTPGGGGGGGATITTMSADQATTSTTHENITELVTGTLAAGNNYKVEAFVVYSSAATTTGSSYGLTFSGTAFVQVSISTPISGGTSNTYGAGGTGASFSFAPATGVSSSLTGNGAYICAMIAPSVSGTAQITFRSEISGSAITALAGSRLVVTQL